MSTAFRFTALSRLSLFAALALGLTGSALAQSRSVQPDGWDAGLAMPLPVDLNPDPDVLEFKLEARIQEMEVIPGKLTPVWSYNGGLPGPLIRLKVGDRLIVHFTNNLPEDTTIHWHGVRVPNAMDGSPGHTQAPVAANGGTFTYDFVVQDAGTFWYHPHINSAAQVGRGLYGPMLVTDPKDPPRFGEDLVLILSDMSLNKEGQFVPADSGGPIGDLFGREGAIVLVNGKVRPTLKVRQGQQQRWRIINAARARYFALDHDGGTFTRLGGDNGLAARAEDAEIVKVVPGERADVVFTPTAGPGSAGMLRWVASARAPGSTFNRPPVDMMRIETAAMRGVRPARISGPLRAITPIDTAGARQRDIRLTIVQHEDGKVEMGINDVPHQHAEPFIAHAGDVEVWTVRNETDFAHPFHIHGFFFQVLDDRRVPEWKDTVDVPSKAVLRLAVRYDDRPGLWMFHCHILDHAEVGMMGHLQVLPRGVAAAVAGPAHH